MDHDFYAKATKSLENLVDTRGQCCLYSFISRKSPGGLHIVNDSIEIITQISRRDTSVNLCKDEIKNAIRNKKQTFSDFVRERTYTKLFRGQMGEQD